jgi:hypothetical protein
MYHLLSRMTSRSLLHVGVHKPERQVALAAKFHTVVPNVIDFLVWNSCGAFSFEVTFWGVNLCISLLRCAGTLLAPSILRWLILLGGGGVEFAHLCSKVYWNSSGALNFEVAYNFFWGGGGFAHPCFRCTVTLLAPSILRWLIFYWGGEEICASLF